jgi:hypothetical protein
MARPYGVLDNFVFVFNFDPFTSKARLDDVRDIYRFSLFFADDVHGKTACTTFLVIPKKLALGPLAGKARSDGVRDIFCVPSFLPMMATARPYGMHEIICYSLKFWPIGKQGQTRQRARHFWISFFFADNGDGQTILCA